MSTRPSGRLISITSAHRPSPWAPISTNLKTQATHPPSVRERARKYPTTVAPPISRRSLMLFVLSHKAAAEPQDLPLVVARTTRVRVSYTESQHLIAHVAQRVEIEE